MSMKFWNGGYGQTCYLPVVYGYFEYLGYSKWLPWQPKVITLTTLKIVKKVGVLWLIISISTERWPNLKNTVTESKQPLHYDEYDK